MLEQGQGNSHTSLVSNLPSGQGGGLLRCFIFNKISEQGCRDYDGYQ